MRKDNEDLRSPCVRAGKCEKGKLEIKPGLTFQAHISSSLFRKRLCCGFAPHVCAELSGSIQTLKRAEFLPENDLAAESAPWRAGLRYWTAPLRTHVGVDPVLAMVHQILSERNQQDIRPCRNFLIFLTATPLAIPARWSPVLRHPPLPATQNRVSSPAFAAELSLSCPQSGQWPPALLPGGHADTCVTLLTVPPPPTATTSDH